MYSKYYNYIPAYYKYTAPMYSYKYDKTYYYGTNKTQAYIYNNNIKVVGYGTYYRYSYYTSHYNYEIFGYYKKYIDVTTNRIYLSVYGLSTYVYTKNGYATYVYYDTNFYRRIEQVNGLVYNSSGKYGNPSTYTRLGFTVMLSYNYKEYQYYGKSYYRTYYTYLQYGYIGTYDSTCVNVLPFYDVIYRMGDSNYSNANTFYNDDDKYIADYLNDYKYYFYAPAWLVFYGKTFGYYQYSYISTAAYYAYTAAKYYYNTAMVTPAYYAYTAAKYYYKAAIQYTSVYYYYTAL